MWLTNELKKVRLNVITNYFGILMHKDFSF